MEYIVTKPILKEELKNYSDYIGFLFKNEDGVYNICDTEEDIIKSNQWFKNLPMHSIIVSQEEIKVNDAFIPHCENHTLNGKVFRLNSIDGDFIKFTGKDGKELTSTIHVLKGAYKFLRTTNREDKEKLVNGIISPLI